jgi:hypothetical protein
MIDRADKVQRPDVQVIDFTALADGSGLNHFVPVTSPSAIGFLRDIMAGTSGVSGAFVRDMTLTLPKPRVLLP